MIRPTGTRRDQIEVAINRQRGSHEVQALVEYLQQRQARWVAALVSNSDECHFRCAQGHAQEVQDIIEVLTKGFTNGNSEKN